MAAVSSEEELVLLERVFLRIGSAETDDQLKAALAKFLTPVLLKLASQADGVRKKVMELLVHINKRVKSRPKIQLPVEDLMQQYTDPAVSPFVTNFSILYIKMGYPRLENEKQAELVQQLVACLPGRPEPQQNSLLQLVMPALQYLVYPSGPDKKKDMFSFVDNAVIKRLLLDFTMDMLLMPYSMCSGKGSTGSSQPEGQGSRPGSAASTQGTPTSPTGTPPGMSEAALKRVTADNCPTADELEKIKLGILKFLGVGIFLDEDVVCHFVAGTADVRHSVAGAADRELKRVTGGQDWDNTAIVSKLYTFFLGTVMVKGKANQPKPEHKRTPGSIHLRLKVFPYLLKSKEAANQFPATVQIVFDCLYGAQTNQKLRIMALQFVHHLCLNCSDVKFQPIGAVLLSGMIKLTTEAKEDPKLRSMAYVAVGKIVRRSPHLVTKDITLLQTFFDAVCHEDAENKLAVQEALSMMVDAFHSLDPSDLKLMEALIMQNIEKPEVQARQIAIRYAVAVFPPNHVPSRYALLLACGDRKDDIYTAAFTALMSLPKPKEEPVKNVVSDQVAGTSQEKDGSQGSLMPSFMDMVNYIHEKAGDRLKTQQKYVMGNNVLAFNPATYSQILMYLRMCLAYSAGVRPALESFSAMQAQAPLIAPTVQRLLRDHPGEKGPIGLYIGLIKQVLTAIGGPPAMYCLLEVLVMAREQLAPQFIKHLDWIRGFMFNTREDMREPASELYALVVSSATSQQRCVEIMLELTENLDKQAFEGQHGSLLGLGFLIGDILARQRQQAEPQSMEVDPSPDDEAVQQTMTKAITQIAKLLDSGQPLMATGACTTLAEIGRNGPLPCDDQDKNDGGTSKLAIVDNLIGKVKASKTNSKVREKAATCLGYLCVGEKEFPHRKKVMESLLDSAAAKQFELHFTIGEALVCAAQGVASPATRDPWLTTESDFQPPAGCSTDEVTALLNLLLTKYARSPNPHIRQAACIWLLAVVKKCSGYSEVQSKLQNIQMAFMNLLNEKDELTQDIASKGLGAVYESCSKDQKDKLVSTLVETLMAGRKQPQQLSGDSEVFQEGALGTTPDGKNLSTYKELCSIANDLNQPDLIYKFMHLANHQAVWNSKKGAAFGFTTIAAQAGEQLAPYLHKIIPKLFRYQFDPNPKIQTAMGSIWTALVPETKKTVDKYLREIVVDLLGNLTSNQWRVRQSSCLALNDVLRGRPLDDVVDLLPSLWETCLRVLDDIKESVREAAELACKSLSRVSIKICNPEYGKVGIQATNVVLPCLLNVGLGSQVKEVRIICLTTIVKISKNAGVLVKPHIPVLVIALLESLSGLEPQVLNYLSLHAASNQETLEKLDNVRLAASKTSPMMEVINECIRYVDEDTLAELIPKVTEQMRSAVGLGTKAGCSNLLTSLYHQCPKLLAPYAGKLLLVLLNGLSDRNMGVRKSFAATIGYIVRVAKDSSVEKLILRLKEWYLNKEDEGTKQVCAVTLHSINQRSPDILRRHAAVALPLAFLAMHDPPKTDGSSAASSSHPSLWEDVWLDATPGTEGGVRMYLTELVELTASALQSQSWLMKAQAAAAMSTIATKLDASLGPPHLGLLLVALTDGLTGRTWAGKEMCLSMWLISHVQHVRFNMILESLLKAISSVCVSCKEVLSSSESDISAGQPTVTEVVTVMLKECRKDNLPYKMEALRCTCRILEAHDIDRFQDISGMLYPMLAKSAKETDVEMNTWLKFEECAYESLGQAWPSDTKTQDQHRSDLCPRLCAAISNSTWKVQLVCLKTLKTFISKLHILRDKEDANNAAIETILSQVTPPLCYSLENVKYSSIRTASLDVVELIFTKLKDSSRSAMLSGAEGTTLRKQLASMSDDAQPELRDRAGRLAKF